jgi:hypothetical protein
MRKYIYILFFVAMAVASAQAGNPDRQGESGAVQLLINPWARSAGLSGMTVATCRGVESMHINPAGSPRIQNMEINASHTRYFDGADIGVTAFGFAKKIKANGALSFSVMSVNVGQIGVTTEQVPEGTGATFSPSIMNIAAGYSHIFGNKVSVGVVFRGVTESTRDVNAFAVGIDAGVQYVSGKDDNFKFGIALRNVGSRMQFAGQGLSITSANPTGQVTYNLTNEKRSAGVQLPSTLSIGASYDVLFGKKSRLSFLGQFTSNSFSRDNIGGGLEFTLNNMFAVRGGYRYEVGVTPSSVQAPVVTGISGGFSLDFPIRKESKSGLGIDYSYQQTNIWKGNHTLALRIAF